MHRYRICRFSQTVTESSFVMGDSKQKPLIAIAGPTASGKTGLAIRLAKKFNGAIICADSRTVYRGMDIGTAKPTKAEMDGVPHYMLDMVEPNSTFTLYDFQRFANTYIQEIREKGQVPFLVGGSGLYIDSILFDYQLGDEPNNELRQKLEVLSTDNLLALIKKQHIEMPVNFNNRRHLIRAIEQNGINKTRRNEIIENAYVVGIATDKSMIEERIRKRAAVMLDAGLVDEVQNLVVKYGPNTEPLRKNLYGEIQKYLNNELTRDELIERMVIVDRQLAKKQTTWFRRNKQIEWHDLAGAEKRINGILSQ